MYIVIVYFGLLAGKLSPESRLTSSHFIFVSFHMHDFSRKVFNLSDTILENVSLQKLNADNYDPNLIGYQPSCFLYKGKFKNIEFEEHQETRKG